MKKNAGELGEIKKFWDEYSETYDEENVRPPEWDIDIQQIKRYLPIDKSIKILDVGGGTGRITLPLARMGYRVTLCDISSGMLDVARRKLSKERLLDRVKTIEADAAKLPFEDGTFDIVIAGGPEPDNLKDVIRVLKEGGKIFVAFATHFTPPPGAIALEYKWIINWKPEEVRELLYKNGVKPIAIYGNRPDVIKFSEDTRKAIKSGDKTAIELWLNLSEEKASIETSESLVLIGEKVGHG